MPKLTVDGLELEVPAGATVLQACELAGKEIPRFCYHERLSIAGNCRMCLVEVAPGPPKPQASCALPAAEGQVIKTNSAMVKKAREGVMEFLLINHPLDCPICDQGGECDLQDQSVAYGRGSSRYPENKRAVTEKYMGPIVKTVMTRCIQCTRCIRFAEEVAGIEEIGAIGRGENMQITSYLERAVTSELSGNVVDLCPVGALTSKPYAFEARPWELKKTSSIDVMDAVGTNIRLDSRGRAVLRALPRINEDVNEEWASDKTRHAVDGLTHRRLDKPYVRRGGKLEAVSWADAFAAIAAVGHGGSVAAIAGDLVDCETMFAARELVKRLNIEMPTPAEGIVPKPRIQPTLLEGRQTGLAYDVSSLSAVNFNTGIAGIENADVILLVGSDLRREAPLVNTRVQKAVRKHRAKVFAIGPVTDLTYNAEFLGSDLGLIAKLPKHVADAFKSAERPAIIVGGGALRYEGAHGAALTFAKKHGLVREGWNGFNVLHFAAARMGGLMLGYAHDGGIKALAAKKPKLAFFLGADEVDYSLFADTFKVYVGHHGDAGATAADVILPGAAYAEKSGTYVNLEGRVQRGERAVFPPGDAREDWSIFRALSEGMGKKLPFDSLDQLRAAMAQEVPALGQEGLVGYEWNPPSLSDKPTADITDYPIKDFYLTNAICRASPTMHRCSSELVHGEEYLEAAE
jgi:NADH-quinone oxidoreductase subunit G